MNPVISIRRFALFLGLLGVLTAQGVSEGASAGKLRVRVFDSETGFPVPVARMASNMSFVPATSNRAGEIEIDVAEGMKEFQLSVPGYTPLNVIVNLTSATREIQVYITPNNVPSEFETKRLQTLGAPSAAGVAGFLSDDQTGQPLGGVRIVADEPKVETLSDARGFFRFSVPVPAKTEKVRTLLTFFKPGYVTLIRSNVELYAGTVQKYRLRLRPGSGKEEANEERFRARGTGAEYIRPFREFTHKDANGFSLPANVRIGMDCGNDPKGCKTIVVNTLEDYSKHVLHREWIPSWDAESLKAGSVAVRGYGSWYTEHPLTDTYDICDYTACQMYDPGATVDTTDAAVDATKGKVMLDGSGAIARSEYAAENNNAGCGDGKTGTNQNNSPCISDLTCKGATKNGHGRGMCQWGSQRWATGKDHDGNPVDGGAELYDWILKHYYTMFTIGTSQKQFVTTIG
jgi:hypothetical protein